MLPLGAAWEAARKCEPGRASKAKRFAQRSAREGVVSVTRKEVVEVLSNLCVIEALPPFQAVEKVPKANFVRQKWLESGRDCLTATQDLTCDFLFCFRNNSQQRHVHLDRPLTVGESLAMLGSWRKNRSLLNRTRCSNLPAKHGLQCGKGSLKMMPLQFGH